MHWRAKLAVQNAIAALPPRFGDPLYHSLQKRSGLKPNCQSHYDFVTHCERLLGNGSAWIAGKSVVELGSGWFPLTPLLLAGLGASEVHTFDLHEHYSPERIREAARALRSFRKEFAGLPFLKESEFSGRLPPVVHYYPRADLAKCNGLPCGKIDLAISRAAIEHIEPDTISRIHSTSHRWLAPDGVWVHLVSPSDHRAYSDKRLHLVDFLRYSEREWQRLSGNRFSYHNRLRRPQYAAIFEATGWRVAKQEFSVPPVVLNSISRVDIHSAFQSFSLQDLVASSLWFVLTRQNVEPGTPG
ncbi:MAG: class I SAM-dependent methyltransferase [Bryobacterales bacterium]